jgi:hypothetical protein
VNHILRFKASRFFALSITIFCLVLPCASQKSQQQSPDVTFQQQIAKYPGFLTDLGHLFERWQKELTFPQARGQSKLLPLLPQSTTYFIAIPNYGDSAHQALEIFHQELKNSTGLRNWWQGEMSTTGPQLEESIDQFYLLSQFLGDEIVISGASGDTNSKPFLVAQVRKPGLREFLTNSIKDPSRKSTFNLRVLDTSELSLAKNSAKTQDIVVLVRPDYVIAAPDLDRVRQLNSLLDSTTKPFPSTLFGQRILRTYDGGVSIVGAADLHSIVSQIPKTEMKDQRAFEQTGFKDMKYLIWDRKDSGIKGVSETELSFTGSRHGIASWLAPPAKLGSLEFVSPKSFFVLSIALKNLGEIFDDVKELASYSNPNAFATLPNMEQALHISLKDDLLSQLQGEITLELHNLDEHGPTWDLILRVKDSDRLQRTLEKLLSSAPVQMTTFESGGVSYHSLVVPAKQQPVRITYAFADGYLLFASSQELAAEAISLHKSGKGLANSPALATTLPAGYSPEVSALLYEDATAASVFQLQRFAPQIASAVPPSSEPLTAAYRAYGEETAIRGVSSSGGFDVAGVLLGAAVAIPNLLRARIAANEASAAATLRTLSTAQITYQAHYPRTGFARNIDALGPDQRDFKAYSPQHAGLIGPELVQDCSPAGWCTRSGYRFHLRAICKAQACQEFVVVGTPLQTATGHRSFCSTSDAVIRVQAGPPLEDPITVSQCRAWPPFVAP